MSLTIYSCRSKWADLPDEIIYNVLSHLDLGSLWSIVQTHSLQKVLFTARYQEMLLSAVELSLPLQFQRITSIILNLRHGEHSHESYKQAWEDLDDWLDDDESPCVIHSLKDPVIALEHIAITMQDIETWTNTFIRSRCVKPTIPDT